MKSKELIRQLLELDPSGDIEVSIGNTDIYHIERLPAYYDGTQQVLIRDEKSQYYNVIGAKYHRHGEKIKLRSLSISEAIETAVEFGQDMLPIDYSELDPNTAAAYRESNEKTRQAMIDMENRLETEHFVEYIKKIAAEICSNDNDIEEYAKVFFEKSGWTRHTPLPADLPDIGWSYNMRREEQWRREVDVSWDGVEWQIVKK